MFGRVAARSQAFASTCASGGAPVVIGSAAGPSAEDVIPRARGELLERVSNILAGRAAESGNARIATFDELRHAGVAAMDPLAWPELGPPAGAGESGHHAADASAPPAGAGESGHHAAD
ncbi:MAG: hypothetical protein ACRD0K_09530, partial [Egibacteraceae bacterium]